MKIVVSVRKVIQEWHPDTNTNSGSLLLSFGGAEVLVPVNDEQLAEAIKACIAEGRPEVIRGAGTQVIPLIDDEPAEETHESAELSEDEIEADLAAELESLRGVAAQLGVPLEELLAQHGVELTQTPTNEAVYSRAPMASPSPFVADELVEPDIEPGEHSQAVNDIFNAVKQAAANERAARPAAPKPAHLVRKDQIQEQIASRGGPAAQNARATLEAMRAKARAHPGRRVEQDDMGYPVGPGVREAQPTPKPRNTEADEDEDGFPQG